ncbi:MAG: carotenoid oxygenase family protein [Deltaproteobacteria bacterium]|nr:carotenoid oxygenase family protein [Deltaproteobacteria bacterium]
MSQSATPAEKTPFHLKGNFAPVFDERTELDLQVTGAIPPQLEGRFFRNGANPQSGWSPHWFLGNGMLHGVELRGGRATWYRNRYVRTPLLDDPEGARISPEGEIDHTRSCANTHVIRHAGRILALEEGSFPFEVDENLETVGVHDFGGKLHSAMTAHPRTCPETGELLFFGYSALPPYLVYHRVAADGTLVQSEEIEVKGPTMMHDWNITRNHVVFMDLPMVFDLSLLASGMPIRWDDDYGARLGVMPRNGTNDDVEWYEIDPCYVFHPMNSYEDGDRIVLDVARFAKLSMSLADDGGAPAVLHRWIIDRAAGKVIEQPLDDRPGEFPRVHDRVIGLKHRFGYMAGVGSDLSALGTSLRKYDVERDSSWTHELGAGCQAGEPVFAPNPGAAAEDEGWILTFVYDPATDKSDLVIIDAQEFDKPPVARIHLPTRVPFGFHGSWLPDDA